MAKMMVIKYWINKNYAALETICDIIITSCKYIY